MTRHLPTLLAFAAVLASPAAGAQTEPAVEARLVDPVHFTDFRVDRWRNKRQAESLARELGGFLERESPRHLPAGSKLTIVVTDVDMAGEFEAFQRAGAGDVRVVRDMYPSRINLAFSLADETGKVVKEGSRKLMSNFVLSPAWGGDGPLRHEKALLQDWLAREFAPGR